MKKPKLPDMGKMVGPLPLGAWLIVLAACIGFAWYNRTHAQPIEEDMSMPSDGTDVDTLSGAIPGVGNGAVGGWTQTLPSTSPEVDLGATLPPVDNIEWGIRASNWAIKQGSYSPAAILSAINKYLSGATLSASEYSIITMILKGFPDGVPPQPVAAPSLTPAPIKTNPHVTPVPIPDKSKMNAPKPAPKPAPKQTPKPAPKPAPKYHTVTRGDSLWSIAVKYYKNPAKWKTIYDANKKTIGSNPNLIKPGQKLLLPGK